MSKVIRFFRIFLVSLIIIVLSSRSQLFSGGRLESIRVYTRTLEFDYVDWTLDAILGKVEQGSLGAMRYVSSASARAIVLDYLKVVDESQLLQWEIEREYSDPAITDPAIETKEKIKRLQQVQAQKHTLAALAESTLQAQISYVVSELGMGFLGQPLPPLLYKVTELPLSLIVSPREVIRQDANISLDPEMDMAQIITLENEVANGLDVSTLVTRIGGVGVYPTMVAQSTSLPWLAETIAHEWIHNYLTLQPLGLRYDTSADLRTMNETTASIAGKEIGAALLMSYYPEFALPPVNHAVLDESGTPEPAPPVFDFTAEMRITRVNADALLAEGKISEAEEYMEERRKVFWNNGYQIRKLNQAYFAFNGAYADVPGGAAGEDPVGAAVRALRSESSDLASFVKKMAAMRSFEDLQIALQ
ncbi:MAG TPA: hypothetical protein PLI60_07765 [Anaerolineaceae bacterium]|nr:hypothetical protein [Anaerolineaceae bacterium]HQP08114.1 hypothetical protein [Anaerolineaceae bacterium]